MRRNRKKIRKPFGSRESPKMILLVCEGEKTEPNYFREYINRSRATQVQIKIFGTGYNTLSLVEETVRLKEKGLKEKEEYDQAWCVFDKDSFSDSLVQQAFAIAKQNGIDIAYSNECFELWYVLHFQYQQSALKRDQLVRLVKRLFQENFSKQYPSTGPVRDHRGYDKADKGIYALLLPHQDTAIKNAKSLHGTRPTDQPTENPSTTVYRLVEELNALFKADR